MFVLSDFIEKFYSSAVVPWSHWTEDPHPMPSICSPLAVGQTVLVLALSDSRDQTFFWSTGTISFFSNIVIETNVLCNESKKDKCLN